ncbi:ImmA/IrrE family metallo-endopeptidase [Pseudoscardovia radai]
MTHPDAVTRASTDWDIQSIAIFYNDAADYHRMRFSLAHEVGHIFLEHYDDNDVSEIEANLFANYLLAPGPLVIRDSAFDTQTISQDFDISYGCARVVLDRTINRLRCGRPMTKYENTIENLCHLNR